MFLYVLLIYAYVVSHDVRSPMKEFADTNWRDQSAIATTELDPNYCITNVPLNCFAPLTSTEEETIQAGDSCDTKCKEFWVGEADDAMDELELAERETKSELDVADSTKEKEKDKYKEKEREEEEEEE